jgi:hypothetical protein
MANSIITIKMSTVKKLNRDCSIWTLTRDNLLCVGETRAIDSKILPFEIQNEEFGK